MARSIRVPNLRFKLPRLPKSDPNQPDVFEEMTLQEHLEELRDRIMRIVIGIVIAFIGSFIFVKPVLEQIQEKANATQGLDISSPTDTLTLTFRVALYMAISITMPIIVYQIVRFLAPGLTRREKRMLFSSLPFVSVLFIGGVTYAYFVAAPRALDFLSGFMEGIYSWDPDGKEVINFFLTLMMGLGLAFQLPVIMFILAKLGIVSAQKMRLWRKYAYVVLLIVSAVITPSTDPINMALVAVPLGILYEIGVVVSSLFAKTSIREADAAESAATG
jgi:sec-independent protein translocase protein TatC